MGWRQKRKMNENTSLIIAFALNENGKMALTPDSLCDIFCLHHKSSSFTLCQSGFAYCTTICIACPSVVPQSQKTGCPKNCFESYSSRTCWMPKFRSVKVTRLCLCGKILCIAAESLNHKKGSAGEDATSYVHWQSIKLTKALFSWQCVWVTEGRLRWLGGIKAKLHCNHCNHKRQEPHICAMTTQAWFTSGEVAS